MTPQQIFAVALRLFALRLALSALNFLGVEKAVGRVWAMTPWNQAAVYAVGAGTLLAGLFLWFFPMLVAHWLLPHGRFADRASPQLHEVVRLGCALVGLWVFFHEALPQLQVKLPFVVAAPDPSEALHEVIAILGHANIVVLCFQLLLAFALLFGGGMFARLVVREQV